MDKEYFMNAGIPQPQLHYDTIPWSGNCPNNNSDHHYPHFDSSLTSIVTSAGAPATETFLLRELIGKLNSGAGAGEMNSGGLAPPPPLPALAGDPGFAERAAKYSCFGSRSFNGRGTNMNVSELAVERSKSPLMNGNVKLPRVSSSPLLKQRGGSSPETKKLSKFSTNSNEESSVSDLIVSGDSKVSNEMSSRKRKGVTKNKTKDNGSAKGDEDGNAKRSKNENVDNKSDEEGNEENEKQKANNQKAAPEPLKDYIHVRARRGQATDSHSLAERVRREKISERMKLLQDLVPGCNKVTGKALMLDEIINYVQSLQRQVEFLSMKLASVNPELDFNTDNLLSKDMFQQNATLPQHLYPMDSSAPAFYQQNVHQQMHNNTGVSGPLGIHLSSVDGFTENLPQFPGFSEDDLHSIVGFVHNFPGQNQMSNMKVER